MKITTHRAAAALTLSILSLASPAAGALEPPEACAPYDPVWQGVASMGLGAGGAIALGVAGATLGGELDPRQGGELLSGGAATGLFLGASVGSIVGGSVGATLLGGPCATPGTIAWTWVGASSATLVGVGVLALANVEGVPGNPGLGLFGLATLFLGAPVGAFIGYNLNYPSAPAVSVAPIILPEGGGGFVVGGRF
jgi:hypothetical protein